MKRNCAPNIIFARDDRALVAVGVSLHPHARRDDGGQVAGLLLNTPARRDALEAVRLAKMPVNQET